MQKKKEEGHKEVEEIKELKGSQLTATNEEKRKEEETKEDGDFIPANKVTIFSSLFFFFFSLTNSNFYIIKRKNPTKNQPKRKHLRWKK